MPSSCGMLRYKDFTSMVARVQFCGNWGALYYGYD